MADALMMAVWRPGKPVALLHHSDQGSQYTSEHFQELLKDQPTMRHEYRSSNAAAYSQPSAV